MHQLVYCALPGAAHTLCIGAATMHMHHGGHTAWHKLHQRVAHQPSASWRPNCTGMTKPESSQLIKMGEPFSLSCPSTAALAPAPALAHAPTIPCTHHPQHVSLAAHSCPHWDCTHECQCISQWRCGVTFECSSYLPHAMPRSTLPVMQLHGANTRQPPLGRTPLRHAKTPLTSCL